MLELHQVHKDEDYHLGIFLVGAYQEILGDLHNLFGDTNEVHVTLDDDGNPQIDHVEAGETVADVLRYVGYHRNQLLARVRRLTEQALRDKRMSLEESRTLVRGYEQALAGYTYLERE